MHGRHLPVHCAYSIALNGFESRRFLLYRGVLRHIKRHEAATCRVIGAGIPAGNIRDHLEERRPVTWEEPRYEIITLSKTCKLCLVSLLLCSAMTLSPGGEGDN